MRQGRNEGIEGVISGNFRIIGGLKIFGGETESWLLVLE